MGNAWIFMKQLHSKHQNIRIYSSPSLIPFGHSAKTFIYSLSPIFSFSSADFFSSSAWPRVIDLRPLTCAPNRPGVFPSGGSISSRGHRLHESINRGPLRRMLHRSADPVVSHFFFFSSFERSIVAMRHGQIVICLSVVIWCVLICKSHFVTDHLRFYFWRNIEMMVQFQQSLRKTKTH